MSVRSITSAERSKLLELLGASSGRNDDMTTTNDGPTPAEQQQVDAVVALVEAQDQLAELKAELQSVSDELTIAKKALATAQMDAASAEDAQKMAEERLVLVQRMVIAAQHSEKQWRETAQANDTLHNAACDELGLLRSKVTVQESMINQLQKRLDELEPKP